MNNHTIRRADHHARAPKREPGSTNARTPPRRKAAAWLILIPAVIGSSIALAFTLRAGRSTGVAPCSDRIAVVGLSSSERSRELERSAINVVAQIALSSAVCARPGEAFAVVGGGKVFSLLSSDDLTRFAPEGPNRAVRLSRLASDAESKLRDLVSQRLRDAYTSGAPVSSSVAALYRVAAEHAGRETDVIVITDGVNADPQANLNRALEAGDGSRLANKIPMPAIGNHQTTVIGIAQVDSTTPPPGPSWPTEVRAFNQRLCELSRAHACRLFSVVSTVDVLAV